MDHQAQLTQYLAAFLRGLSEAGVRQVVISPGSRSTPLALMLHRHPAFQTYLDVDERSAGFFALGLSKATGAAVGLVCTSGSAAANYLPAICEAEATNLPLVVMTTDRPAELQGVGAPQAMDQHALYGDHVKAMVDLALPEATPALLNYAHWQAVKLTSLALTRPQGPVHLNLPLREPLLPSAALPSPSGPSSQVLPVTHHVDLTPLRAVLQQRGLIIVGEERTPAEATQLAHLAETLGWPVVGDPLTNLAATATPNYLGQADLLFQAALPMPEVILRFGRLPVTKPVMQWLRAHPLPTILVENGAKYQDQLHQATWVLDQTVTEFVAAVANLNLTAPAPDWLIQWQACQKQAAQLVASVADQGLNHSTVAQGLPAWLHDQDLFVANSNAIRLVDRLALTKTANVRIFGNRGVNGIDGLVSTVAGLAAGRQRPVTLLIGDLALFHDMNGLAMLRRYQLPVTIVLLNNNGGGIFNFLAQRHLPAADFTALFQTPQDLDFARVAALYDFTYHHPQTPAALQACLNQPGQHLIEVTDAPTGPVTTWEALVAAYQTAVTAHD